MRGDCSRFPAEMHRLRIELIIMDIFPKAERPSIVSVLIDDVDFIRRQVVAQQVAAHLRDPYLLRLRVKGHKHRVPEACGEGSGISSLGWDGKDLRPSPVLLDADIAG